MTIQELVARGNHNTYEKIAIVRAYLLYCTGRNIVIQLNQGDMDAELVRLDLAYYTALDNLN